MDSIDTLLHPRWVIPVAPHDTVLEHHSVAIDRGRIVAVLPQAEAQHRFCAREVLDLDEHVLIPGLINAHTHSPMTLLRGLADDLPLMRWLQEHIWPAEGRWVSPEFVRVGTQLAMAEMLRGGVTCFNDMYFFPDTTARVAAECGMRASIGLIVIEFATAWAKDATAYLQRAAEVRAMIESLPRITATLAPHAPYTVAPTTLERVLELSEQWQMPIHIHLHETVDEIQQCQREHGHRPLALLDTLGLLGPRLLAVHMTQLEADEIERLAATGTHVLHCPEANLKLASGFCPTARLAASGVNLALGTDGCASNNDLDLFGEMRTAALLAKAVAADATALPAADALHLATLGAARALGLDDEIGSIECGKLADLCAVKLDALETTPIYHPISQLVYATPRTQVSHVWIEGKAMLVERELQTLNASEIAAEARQWGRRIAVGDAEEE